MFQKSGSFTGLWLIALLVWIFTTCSENHVTDGGTETGNAKIVGKLYQADGKTPAVNALVSIRPRNSLANISGLIGLAKKRNDNVVVATDSCGYFRFDSTLDTGTYTIEATSGNDAALIDSVVVIENGTDTLPPDTLKPAGSITGVIKLTEGGDPRKVFVLAFGIDRFAMPDTNGVFSFDSLAEAAYHLRILSTIDDYKVIDTFNVAVHSGMVTDLDTIELPYSGLGSPKGLSAIYDTLHGCVVLSWKPVNAENLAGYVVFRNDTVSKVPVRLSDKLVSDTLFIDTVFSGFSDTTGRILAYRIKVQDKDANVSTAYSKAITISAPPPRKVRTAIMFRLLNTRTDTASINDTVAIVALYRNETRRNVKLEWFIGTRDSSIRTVEDTALAGVDTLLISWSDTSVNRVYVSITDEGGAVWRDSTVVHVVQDIPEIYAGGDIDIAIADTLKLHGTVNQRFGKIKKYEWDIGNKGVFMPTSTSDTAVTVSEQNMNYQCVFRVTDDDENTVTDTLNVRIYEEIVKDVDGNIYHALRYGNQVWMLENLKVSRKNDGTPLNYFWYEHDSKYREQFGGLYLFNEMTDDTITIPPKGWRVPNNNDWDTLINFLVANGYNWDGTRSENKIGKALASKESWRESGTEGAVGYSVLTNNSSYFTAQPSGAFIYEREKGNFFDGMNRYTIWRSSTVYRNYLYVNCVVLDWNKVSLEHHSQYPSGKYSIRCIKR
jgi:uncharacterized protein (TIGR02145 family)